MISVDFKILDTLKKLIENDEAVTITLNRNDLICLHSAILDEKVFMDEFYAGVNYEDGEKVKEFCERVAEYRADSVSDMETLTQNIAKKFLNKN